MDRLNKILKAVDKLEKRLWISTEHAESRCCSVEISFSSDGSCSLKFQWTQKAPTPIGSSKNESGLRNLLATIEAGPNMVFTQEIFSNVDELMRYFSDRGFL